MVKHKPAMTLPWTIDDSILPASMEDAAYIAHAANAYPQLVEHLRAVCNAAADFMTIERAAEFLRELGE